MLPPHDNAESAKRAPSDEEPLWMIKELVGINFPPHPDTMQRHQPDVSGVPGKNQIPALKDSWNPKPERECVDEGSFQAAQDMNVWKLVTTGASRVRYGQICDRYGQRPHVQKQCVGEHQTSQAHEGTPALLDREKYHQEQKRRGDNVCRVETAFGGWQQFEDDVRKRRTFRGSFVTEGGNKVHEHHTSQVVQSDCSARSRPTVIHLLL
mmetsp:Transcript_26044/g.60043  ORF Transcript_26044/g.60043 Transcript_26044/m.60043 type:complete len:209 (+) Transcript_26044:326-952(+)